ncbi:RUBREDOXIN [Salix koriyanagi]|uniref:RUBREDOXIN n=1 Tax=Salix koriyanagi TaxID=2511006 RepID=A0A9Q1A477_9ROSI|nr:RUBREDOXIN [Salix koriyanagi]
MSPKKTRRQLYQTRPKPIHRQSLLLKNKKNQISIREVGDPSYTIPPGFQFDKLPDDGRCSTCGAAKTFFESKSVEIAGFAQNQRYGSGGNALTSGQKAFVIYGTLLFFSVLFLSGYSLQ